MTKADFIQLVDNNGGDEKLLCIIFDNDYRIRFTTTNPFDRSMIETYGETDLIVRNQVVERESTHKICLPVRTYYNMDGIQYCQFVQDPKDKGDIGKAVYMDLR